jgi:CBS domain containing-hemolysin-like protein
MTVAMTLVVTVATAVSIALAFIASAAESAVRSVPLARVRRLRESNEQRGAAAFDVLAERPSHVGAAHALVSGGAFATVAAVGTWGLQSLWSGVPVWADALIAVIVAAVLVFALGEALPRALVAANAEGMGLAVAGAASVLTTAFHPVARLLSMPWTSTTRLITGEHAPDAPWSDAAEDHRFVAGEDEPTQGESNDDILEAVAGLEQKVVREVMVPRTDMVAIEDTDSIADALEAIVAGGVSRVPVYHETLDDVRGILYAKDLLLPLADPTSTALPIELVRPALFVPETKPIEDLLREMRRRTHIAIVADEYGGTAGLVTIEDLLEQIVGEIFDEYDPRVAMVTQLDDGRVRVDARLAIDEIDERFGTALDVEADTAAGLFTELAGHIPQAGESVEVQGLRFTVEAMEGNRVRQLIIEPVPAHMDEEAEE